MLGQGFGDTSGGHRAPGCCCRHPRAGAGQEGTGFRHLVGNFKVPSSGRASILAVSQENYKIIKEIGKISKGEVFEMSCSVGQHHKHKRRGKMKGGFFIILVLRFFALIRESFRAQVFAFNSTSILESVPKPPQIIIWGFPLQTSLPPLGSD